MYVLHVAAHAATALSDGLPQASASVSCCSLVFCVTNWCFFFGLKFLSDLFFLLAVLLRGLFLSWMSSWLLTVNEVTHLCPLTRVECESCCKTPLKIASESVNHPASVNTDFWAFEVANSEVRWWNVSACDRNHHLSTRHTLKPSVLGRRSSGVPSPAAAHKQVMATKPVQPLQLIHTHGSSHKKHTLEPREAFRVDCESFFWFHEQEIDQQ